MINRAFNLQTINTKYQSSYRIRGSRFLGYLLPVSTVEQFDLELGNVKSEHPAASHHCYAWRIQPSDVQEYSQDDGEPAGTAGVPILNQLRSREMVNATLIVVRYFGGTKLGKSGLIDAYRHTAETCIQNATRFDLIPTKLFNIVYDYDYQNLIEKWKSGYNLIEKRADYTEKVSLTVACSIESAESFHRELQDSEHLLIHTEPLDSSYEIIART